ncbi:hypothetical protein A2783_05725 [Microgenomates group bacterium RIFCSPHIGHO2_01_FULL_45_11]|nr:MAG: hypothetical protein A2783_05725 [Microgenomates group bacterium RIFCSPHIGHO2_01_FULL_45_11]
MFNWELNPETLPQELAQGVFCLLNSGEMTYLVPQVAEDNGKFEVVFGVNGGQSLVPIESGYLGIGFGSLGGKVEPKQTLNEAMRVEFSEELSELVRQQGGDGDRFQELFGGVVFSQPGLLDFLVMQARQQNEGEAVFRALFQVHLFRVSLSQDQLSYLTRLGLLTPVADVELSLVRPFLRPVLGRNNGYGK